MARKYYKKRRRARKPKIPDNGFILAISIIHIFAVIVFQLCRILYKVINSVVNYFIKRSKVRNAIKKIDAGYGEIMDIIYTINSRQFEILIAELFKNCGRYAKVEITKATCDYGRDCILTNYIKGRKEVTFVEIKHYAKDNYVGRPVVQKLLGSCQMFGAEKAMIVTTGKYHRNAYECKSKVSNLELMDVLGIKKMILSIDVSLISGIMYRVLNVV